MLVAPASRAQVDRDVSVAVPPALALHPVPKSVCGGFRAGPPTQRGCAPTLRCHTARAAVVPLANYRLHGPVPAVQETKVAPAQKTTAAIQVALLVKTGARDLHARCAVPPPNGRPDPRR